MRQKEASKTISNCSQKISVKNSLHTNIMIDSSDFKNNQETICYSNACKLARSVINVLMKLGNNLKNSNQELHKNQAETLFQCVRLLQNPFSEDNTTTPEHVILAEKGNVLLEKNQLKDALSIFSAALKLCPSSSLLLLKRSICHTKMSNSTEALKDAIKSAENDNTNLQCKLNLAKCYLNTGRITKAEEIINKILIANPECSEALKEKDLIRQLNSFESKVEVILERAKRFIAVEMYDEAKNELMRATNSDDAIRLHPEYIKIIADIKSRA